jgi:hypothetical protein
MMPLWLHRRLLNWQDVYRYGIESGMEEMVSPNQLHVTLATARAAVDWTLLGDLDSSEIEIAAGEKPLLDLGLKNEVCCLSFESDLLTARNREIAKVMSIDYPDAYHPHVTLKRDHPVLPRFPYMGKLIFGPEIAQPFIGRPNIPQQPINRNQYRVPLGLPAHDDKEAKTLEWSTQERRRRFRAQARRVSRIPKITDFED